MHEPSRHASTGWRDALPSRRLPATIVLPAAPGIRQGILMNEDEILPSRDVVLGFNGALGFAPADLTSPALAAAAGALVDVTLADAPGSGVSAIGQPVTELRVHGVSGSDGPTMLEHPAALQVAGDKVTGFYRRWSPDGRGRPSVPWLLEAYSWGGLTEAPLASAAWLLLAPFMFYNVAHFALPPARSAEDPPLSPSGPIPHLATTPGHRLASGLLRLLALAATVQFVTGAAVVMVSTVAWQAAGRAGMLPNWMGWYGRWTTGWRVALAMAAVAGIVAGLWWLSVATGRKYEGRITKAQQELNARWPLTQPGFWKGELLVGRQRALHSAAALAALALIGAMSAGHASGARWVAIFLAAAVLAAAAVSVCAPMAERHTVSLVNGGEQPRPGAGMWCRWVLVAAVAALATASLVSGFTDTLGGAQPTTLPGITTFSGVLLAAQVGLLIALAGTVAVLAARVRPNRDDLRRSQDLPYLRGMLGALFPALGLLVGGMLTAVVSLGVTRLLGTPLPSGFRFGAVSPNAIEVPWPIYAFGAEPVGLLAGAIVAATVLWLGYRGHRRGFETAAPGSCSTVAGAYRDQAQPSGGDNVDGDDSLCRKNRRAIARAWAVGLLAEDAAAALAWVVAGGTVVVIAVAVASAFLAGSARHPAQLAGGLQGVASFIALLGALAMGWFISRLRRAYGNVTSRRNIGMLWDIFTFWPRAVHPLAPPCYAERAVPELVDRIRLLTGDDGRAPDDAVHIRAAAEQADLRRTRGLTVPPGPVMLTGYSQGSVIAAAAIAQLPPQVREHVALLTLACPARRLHGRAFPAFFGPQQLGVLGDLLDTGPGRSERGRWKNLRRRSDYYGSWIFAEPEPRLSDEDLASHVDQPCWDPVVLVPDADPTPPPIHRHAAWWPDPRTAELGTHLVTTLARRRNGEPPAVVKVPAQADPVARATPATRLVEGAESAD
jgi:ketosteroid isomerase-like protein